MPNKTVALVFRCKTETGWKYYPAVFGKNGRVRPGFGLVDGEQTFFSAGHYELRFYEGRKLRYENVGESAATAFAAMLNKEKRLAAQTAAADAGIVLEEAPGRVYLRRAALQYIEDRKNQGAAEAARDAEVVTGEFIADCGRTFLDEVVKDDIYRYQKALRQRGNSDRTVANKYQRLRSFLRFAGIDVKEIMPPKPKYEKQLPTVYTMEQVAALIEAADPYMGLVIELATKCGLRELEMVYLEWPDIHWKDKVLRVQGKAGWGFKVKDSEQRDIPIPDDLLGRLKTWREDHPGLALILGTKKGKPNMHLLRQLKRLANRAKLNCRVCEGCNSKGKECQEWTLHKFRRTYATTLLRNGIDLRTVQHFMGHADLASTMRYLRPASTSETQSRINAIQWG